MRSTDHKFCQFQKILNFIRVLLCEMCHFNVLKRLLLLLNILYGLISNKTKMRSCLFYPGTMDNTLASFCITIWVCVWIVFEQYPKTNNILWVSFEKKMLIWFYYLIFMFIFLSKFVLEINQNKNGGNIFHKCRKCMNAACRHIWTHLFL